MRAQPWTFPAGSLGNQLPSWETNYFTQVNGGKQQEGFNDNHSHLHPFKPNPAKLYIKLYNQPQEV